jgi:DNA-binding PadR family transcriptional regulator
MKITLNEEILLLCIWRLEGEAYGVKIRTLFKKYTQKEVAFGTLYNNLDQLVRKELITSFRGEPTAVRGGKAKVYYQITDRGREALQSARELHHRLWQDVPELAFVRREK